MEIKEYRQIGKLGHSQYITLPKKFLENMGVKIGDWIILLYEGEQITIKPAKKETIERKVKKWSKTY